MPRERPLFPRWLPWLAAALALTAWLGRLDLLDPDEARHAEVAREMLAAGAWLTPVLHGEPYYDKPAAFYWLLGACLSWLGENALAARLPCALAALWTMLVTARFARRAYGADAAALAVLGLATTVSFVVLGRTVIVDMPFTAAMTTAFASLGSWHLAPAAERPNVLPFYVALGVACLLKGPAALALGGLAAVGVAASSRSVATLAELRPFAGMLVVIAIAAPWYVAAGRADPDYLREFLLRHNVERYLRPIGAGHVEPWWYYGVALPAILLPWTPLAAAATAARLRRATRTAADVYCAIWAGAVLVFFLPASTKLATYLLPALPPVACLTAAWLTTRLPALPSFTAPYAGAWTALVAAGALAACGYAAASGAGPGALGLALAATSLAASATAWRARSRRTPALLLVPVAVASLALTSLAYTVVADHFNRLRATRTAAALTRRMAANGGELVAYRCVPHAVAFYAGQPALRTREPRRALAALERGGALLTERKRLPELGLDPLPDGVRRAWENAAGLVLLVLDVRERGGEGRESNPPPTLEAGVTVLKTGRATGPDPSPSRSRSHARSRAAALD